MIVAAVVLLIAAAAATTTTTAAAKFVILTWLLGVLVELDARVLELAQSGSSEQPRAETQEGQPQHEAEEANEARPAWTYARFKRSRKLTSDAHARSPLARTHSPQARTLARCHCRLHTGYWALQLAYLHPLKLLSALHLLSGFNVVTAIAAQLPAKMEALRRCVGHKPLCGQLAVCAVRQFRPPRRPCSRLHECARVSSVHRARAQARCARMHACGMACVRERVRAGARACGS
eukprot:6205548-Pleurochrysis_carterae.AAC.2